MLRFLRSSHERRDAQRDGGSGDGLSASDVATTGRLLPVDEEATAEGVRTRLAALNRQLYLDGHQRE